MKDRRIVLFVVRSPLVGAATTLTNLTLLTGFVWLGQLLESWLMQLLGVGLWLGFVVAWADYRKGKGAYLSIEDARRRLDEIEKEARS